MFRVPWLLLVVLVTVRSDPELHPDVSEAESSKAAVPLGLDQPMNYGARVMPRATCYACVDCERVFYNTSAVTCPYNPDNSKMHKCVTYVEKYKYLGKPWFIRGCASERGTCAEIRKAHDLVSDDVSVMSLSSCYECEGERCNGVSRSLPMAFLTFVVTPILAKLALS